MMKPDPQAADALVQRAQEIAAIASRRLAEEHSDVRARYGAEADAIWQEHLYERVLELSAALAVGQPTMFSARVVWSKTAMAARDLRPDDLDASLGSLRMAIEQILTGTTRTACLACLDRAQQSNNEPTRSIDMPTLDPGLAPERLALKYIQAVVAGNVVPGMEMVIDALDDGMSVPDIYVKVLLPALREVGRMWHVNEVSVAEEHLVTNTTQRLMAVLAARTERRPDRGTTAIAASVAGNVHDVAIRTIAYLFEFEGWRTIYLGTDTPRSELVTGVSIYNADVVLLSAGLSTQLRAMKQTIDEIRKRCDPSVKILVGGNAFADSDELWKEMGADGFARNADESLIKAEELVSGVT